MKVERLLAGGLLASLVLGCESRAVVEPGPPPLPAIHALIISDGLQKVRLVEVLVDSPTDDAQVFRVVHGDPVPPYAGCFPGLGDCTPRPLESIGIAYHGDAGWLLNAPPESVVGLFDVKPTHGYLATAEFFALVSAWNQWVFQQEYKALLAADPDLPIEGLRYIAAAPDSWIHAYIGELLLNNPTAAADREVLEHLAALPVLQGDTYREVRLRAQYLLSLLP